MDQSSQSSWRKLSFTFVGSCSIRSRPCVCSEQLTASCCPLSVLRLESHEDDSRHDNLSTLSAVECAVRAECCHPNCSRGTRRNPCLLRRIHHDRTGETSTFCIVELSDDEQQNLTLASLRQQTEYLIKRFSTFSSKDRHRNHPRLILRCFYL